MPWMWESGHLWGSWAWLLMPFVMALMWMPLILLVAWGARTLFGTAQSMNRSMPPMVSTEPDARELARRAYARSELTRERFVQIIEDLGLTERATR